jgi:heme-degrading monooxygenase HmoA
MFLRITHTRIDPSKATQANTIAQEVVDSVSQLPGFQHAYQAGDATSGEAVIVSLWDTREHAQFDRNALGDIVARIQEMGAQLDAPKIYEVNAHS